MPLDAGLGIDLRRFDPVTVTAADRAAARRELGATTDDDVVVGVVGRLVREKGYPELFAAALQLRRGHPDIRVAAIGPDEPDKSDRLTALDSVERAKVLRKIRVAEDRANEVRAMMARRAAEEAAAKVSRE